MTIAQWWAAWAVWLMLTVTGKNPAPLPAFPNQPVVVTPTPPPPSPTGCKGTAPHPGDICWSNQWWITRTSNGLEGPGPNLFTSANVSVQSDGLHLKVNDKSSEVISENVTGYGTYTWKINTPDLDKNIALSLFTWNDAPDYAHREIDFEQAKWGQVDPTNAQWVVQPYTNPANLKRINIPVGVSTVSFKWEADKVTFNLNGATWVHQGAPKPSAQVHMNLWGFAPNHPTQEVIIQSFTFSPL